MSGGFSPETRQRQIEIQGHRCALLGVEVDKLEGHHCVPKVLGGSNNPHNCRELAGNGAYSVYGIPVPDIHEQCDQKALKERLYLHPDTLEFVTRDKMPEDCFRNEHFAEMPDIPKAREKKHRKKGKKHR